MRLAAALSIFAASLLFILLGRMKRDAGGRADTMYFVLGASAAAMRLVVLAGGLLAGRDLLWHPVFGRIVFGFTLLSAYALLLFSYSFPFNRRAPRWLLVGAGVPTVAVLLAARTAAMMPPYGRAIFVAYFIPLVGAALYFQHRNHRAIVREAGRAAAAPIRIVQASIAVPWVASSALMLVATLVHAGRPPQSLVVAQSLLSTIAVMIGVSVAVLRYHLLDIRVMAYELTMAVAACAAYSSYVVWGACALFEAVAARGGTALAAAAVTVAPPLVLRSAWGALRVRMNRVACAMARKHQPRPIVERVLAETSRVVDPAGVFAHVSAAIGEVTHGAVRFLRVGATTPPEIEGPEAPEALVRAAALPGVASRRYVARAQCAELPAEMTDALDQLDACLLVPVRRGATVYGFFQICAPHALRDAAEVCATLADHLAIKLENFALYTEAALNRRELDETRLFLENLVESLPVGVAVLDPHKRVTLWNPALAARSGVPAAEAIGKHYFDDLNPGLLAAGGQAIVDELKQNPWRVVQRVGMPDGDGATFTDVTVASFRDRDGSPKGVVVITQEATERVRLGRELEESRRLAALGAFAAAIAHDIRTPLTSIQMNVQILRSRAGLSEGDREYLEIAIEEINRLNRSVGEILDYAKPLSLNMDSHDVSDLIDDVARTVQPLFSERGINLVARAPEAPLRVVVDERRIRQVLVNVLDNAADASARGSSVEIGAHRNADGRVVLAVTDHGKGIASQHLERVFEPFFTTRPDGTGLGLALAQKIVRAHEGEIAVTSEVGRGTTFEITLATTHSSSATSLPSELGATARSAVDFTAARSAN